MPGDAAVNLKLSQARAQSVISALVPKGIVATRLTAFGNGPYSPVASNKTEEGRAKNRTGPGEQARQMLHAGFATSM